MEVVVEGEGPARFRSTLNTWLCAPSSTGCEPWAFPRLA
ncbi:homoserine kinase domain protein [Mycobacterium ulcerans str. Harvey]|uniref:Homoserine kinase domain protein n=1 Tax=Mycobacterium ulcerans str. Harvey TaxID=1299332 RepID=A0ABN0QQT5_MYCUL|nr:homoserine kinase domain protein [Mycobacterium ulcerans str. Harvey]